jgi:hypothetical protein
MIVSAFVLKVASFALVRRNHELIALAGVENQAPAALADHLAGQAILKVPVAETALNLHKDASQRGIQAAA